MTTKKPAAKAEGNAMELMPRELAYQQPLVATPAAAPTPSDLLAMALQQGAGIEQMRDLMALQERHDANQARKAYVAAMAAFKLEPLTIYKTKAVGYETSAGDFVGYKHATLADVVDAVLPAMARHGLSHAWTVSQASGQVTVACVITHALGHSERVEMSAAPDKSGKKNAIQEVASTVHYLQRYTLQSATGVAARDMDDDGQGSEGSEPAGAVDLAEATLHDWEEAIRDCENRGQLAGIRKDMIDKLGAGSIDAVPQRLRTAALNRAAELDAAE